MTNNLASCIYFVAVVYNNYDDTHEFCSSLLGQSRGHFESIICYIVNNSDCPEISRKLNDLPREFEFVKVLTPASNLGYFGAFNFFLEKVSLPSGAALVLCNNDLKFHSDFCAALDVDGYCDDVFVVCPDVITVDGVHQNPHVQRCRTPLQRLKLDLYFSHFYVARGSRWVQSMLNFVYKPKRRMSASSPGYLHMGIGACYVLLPVFLKKFKQLNFPHFLYGEEAYLTNQVHLGGGRLYYDPRLKVDHKESATLSKLPSRITYEYGRAGYRYYRKFY